MPASRASIHFTEGRDYTLRWVVDHEPNPAALRPAASVLTIVHVRPAACQHSRVRSKYAPAGVCVNGAFISTCWCAGLTRSDLGHLLHREGKMKIGFDEGIPTVAEGLTQNNGRYRARSRSDLDVAFAALLSEIAGLADRPSRAPPVRGTMTNLKARMTKVTVRSPLPQGVRGESFTREV